MDIGTIDMEHEFSTDRFIAALFEADDIGAIIRCHYEAEQALNFVLDRLTEGRSRRQVSGWHFAQRLEVCRVIGINDNWLGPLKLLNDHRNDLAHKGQSQLTNQQVLDLYHQVRRLNPLLKEDFRLTIKGKYSYDKTYREASIKEKYVICVILATSLLASIPQIEKKLRSARP